MTRVAALALLVAGCTPATRADVWFEADADLAARAVSIEIRVEDAAGAAVLEQTTSLADHPLPVAVRLTPRGGGSSGGGFFVVAHLLDGTGARIARVAQRGFYSNGIARELRLRFTAGCDAGLACAGQTSCHEDACRDACDPGIPECGHPGDAGAPDAAFPDFDAGPPHVPAYVERSVASFDATAMGSWRSALGDPVHVDATGAAWVVLATGALRASAPGPQAALARLTVDGAEIAVGSSAADDASGGGPFTAFALLAEGSAHDVDVELQPFATGTTATIEDLSVLAFPLPVGTEVYEDLRVPEQLLLSSTGTATVAEVRFTPGAAGRHLVLGQVSLRNAPSVDAAGARIEDAGGASWPMGASLTSTTNDRQTLFLARAPMLSAGAEARFTLQVVPGAPSSNASHAHVLAIALDGFAMTRHDEQLAAGTTSASSMVLAEVLAPAGPVRDWIVIGAVALASDRTRGAVIRAGDAERRWRHVFTGGARVGYPGFLAVASGASFTASTATVASGGPVDYREAVVHALALP